MRVIIIHGTEGSPETAWFTWLADKVRAAGHEALIPAFPTPKGQKLDRWRAVVHDEVGQLQPDDVLVGHSVGGTFMVRLLEKMPYPIAASFFVAPFINSLNEPEYDHLTATFVGSANWDFVKRNAGRSFVYYGDDDPWVPAAEGNLFVEKLGAKLTVVPGGKHLGDAHGCTELPPLWEDLATVLDPGVDTR